ncbi:MAG TPA: LytTR family DNA-binding domain-containing protein [Thermoanaerobaculia bacterium]|nr:LytTR family DNA-binding domain-containing protein [Thermoanaerobaculia bacterium]
MKIVIVDDEPLARKAVRVLAERDPEITVAAECSGNEAAELIAKTQPDILFLDIQMPEVDGFALLDEIGPAAVPAIVFVTAYDQYALRAFDVHALDYLLKPFDDARFHAALERAKKQVRSGRIDERLHRLLESREPAATLTRRFLVRQREKVLFVKVEDIDWIEAADYYVSLHTDGKSHLIRETMAEVEKQLDPERFVRVHRSAIVNIDRVKEMHPMFRGDCMLILQDGTQLRLSRGRRDEFERRMRAK